MSAFLVTQWVCPACGEGDSCALSGKARVADRGLALTLTLSPRRGDSSTHRNERFFDAMGVPGLWEGDSCALSGKARVARSRLALTPNPLPQGEGTATLSRNEQAAFLMQRVCPVCGRGTAAPYLEKRGLRLVRCESCSMVYTNPVGREFASGEYYDREGAVYYLSAAKLQSDYAAVRFARELKLFREYCQGGAVLDVGCSTGAFLFQLNQQISAGIYGRWHRRERSAAGLRGIKTDTDNSRRFSNARFWEPAFRCRYVLGCS